MSKEEGKLEETVDEGQSAVDNQSSHLLRNGAVEVPEEEEKPEVTVDEGQPAVDHQSSQSSQVLCNGCYNSVAENRL